MPISPYIGTRGARATTKGRLNVQLRNGPLILHIPHVQRPTPENRAGCLPSNNLILFCLHLEMNEKVNHSFITQFFNSADSNESISLKVKELINQCSTWTHIINFELLFI